MDFLIQNGVVVNAEGSARTDVLVQNGRIAAMGEGLACVNAVRINAEGCFLLPGFIDTHTHFDLDTGSARTADDFVTGGRAAEEVVFGEITTGASNDIEQATKLARAMIMRYGMSDDFDMVALETVTNQYLGGDASLACSADTQKVIDDKVVALVKTQHEKAKKILTENRPKLDVLAQYLYEKETITGEEFMTILEREGAKA